ncbi:hypothetical protein [Saccharopolyspora pogona]|nr:hypothetical protein [Saccharopolyspora pogona]
MSRIQLPVNQPDNTCAACGSSYPTRSLNGDKVCCCCYEAMTSND